jgi:type VI secretion system secreted protein Hcp
MPSRHRFPRLLPWISSLAVAAAVGYSLGPGPASQPASHTTVSPSLAALTRPLAATAGDPIFLKVAGVTGEATDKLHPNWIQLQSYNWGASRSGRIANFSPITVGMSLSKAVPQLLTLMATNRIAASAEIQASKTTSQGELNYLTITMSNVSVTALSESANSSGAAPAETMSLSFSRIIITYTERAPNGTLSNTSACWDVGTNSQCLPG